MMSCEYCKDEKQILGSRYSISKIMNGELIVISENGYVDSAKINYCPKCGERLGGDHDE